LKHFLPDDSIVLLDVEAAGTLTSLEFRHDGYVWASGAALPFLDGAFDIVTAHDTLEHIPPALRRACLDEIVRVARRFVIVSGPVWSENVDRAEARLDAFVKTVLRWEQPFLAEHLALGLPDPVELASFFATSTASCAEIPNGNLRRWLTVQALRHYLAAFPDSESLREAVDRAYNRTYAEDDNDGECYRRAYVAARRLEDVPALARVAAVATPSPEPATLSPVEDFMEALEGHAGAVRAHLEGLHEKLYRAENEAYELRGTLEETTRSLGDTEALSREQQAIIKERDAQLLATRRDLENARTELETIKATIAYRVVRGMRSVVRSVTGKGGGTER
jgi:hypothetical protein